MLPLYRKKLIKMETVTLTYNSDNTFAKKMLDAILASGAFSIERKAQKSELQKSIEETRKGKYFVAKNAKDAISKCLA